ncbi:YhjD/YihY/BrkB family envelope integrity protein [Nonomuraea muscovyensis]
MAQFERGANRIYGVERDRPFPRKYARAALLALVSTVTLFRASPRRRQQGHSWLAFGALLALGLWTLLTLALALYTANSGTFGDTYGPLTAVVALMLWSFLSSIALFLGVAFAAQLEACRAGCVPPAHPDPGPTAEEEREPLVGAVGSAAITTARRVVTVLGRKRPGGA